MKLKDLLKELPGCTVYGNRDVDVSGITSNSQVVAPGHLFVAKRGAQVDGHHFIPKALDAGAVAILCSLFNPQVKVVQIVASDVTEAEAFLASRLFEDPSRKLFVVGVTGTNGKTTSTYMIKHLLDQASLACGVIGTVDWLTRTRRLGATMTTPDVVTCHRLLKEMVVDGCGACAMEVSSHALVQKRVAQIDFDVAIFTNLTQDHLDYHKTMESYAEAKSLLFQQLKSGGLAVINLEDPWAGRMKSNAPTLTIGFSERADLRAENVRLYADRSECQLVYGEQSCPFTLAIPGRFNVLNALGAIAVGLHRGLPLQQCAEALSSFSTVRGRLQRVENKRGVHLFVDYAHNDDSLKNVLRTVREMENAGRLFVVFGAGGDRDKGKRPLMGKVAAEWADRVIVTSDNPRSEDPEAIARDILSGIQQRDNVTVELDRASAIALSIREAKKGDVIIIAGKGHETTQIFRGHQTPFDDVEVAAACFAS